MSRGEKNMSSYQHRKDSITWTIEWRFHTTDVVIVDNRVDERTKLCSVIEKHLKLGPCNTKLRPFCEEQLDRLKFFIRVNAKRPNSSYRELDIKSSISQQLTNTLIVEYPVIYVFLPSASFDFKVVKDAAPPPYKLSVPNSPIPKRATFKEEEPKEEEDPQILDPMKSVNAESMLRGETEDDELFFSNFEDLELLENSGFNFEQDLRDGYSGLIGDINPDDFLDLDGDFLQGFSD
ncbi:box C/D snoRNA protein 1-like [Papaver somniferum]|uniref:box C/D snoRNA protein 1-like n=1 Tax=Papaver somniferum TaxID=3469 RepID=UPI000E6F7C26|nr:box C/D snoRNA protein 1-like [Papaver somniferum]